MTVDQLADEISRAVLECPHVAGLSPTVATYLSGRVVPGVAVRERQRREVEVRVIAWWGPTMAEVADQVRSAVRRIAPAVPLTITIDDLDFSREKAEQPAR